MRNHISQSWASINECSVMFVQILRSEKEKLQNTVPGQLVFDDCPFVISRVISSRDILLLFLIDVAANGRFCAVSPTDEV